MPYATAAQLIARYDVRLLGDLASDADTRVASGSLAANDRIIAAMADSTAEIDAAIRQADRYIQSDIDALIAGGDTLLTRLCCDLALGHLYKARGTGVPEYHAQVIDDARQAVKDLGSGKTVLAIATARSAGLPSSATPTQSRREELTAWNTNRIFPRPPEASS